MELNKVKQAVILAGGPTRVASKLQVSGRTINYWQTIGYVPKFHQAEELALLAKNTTAEDLRKPVPGTS